MTEKKKKTENKLEIKTRQPQKKGLFDSLGKNREKTEHPLKEILNLGRPKDENLVDQNENLGRPKDENLVDWSTKNRIWSTKKQADLVDQSTKNENLVDQKHSVWSKYEKARETDRIGLRPNKENLRKFRLFCLEKGLTLTEFFEISGLKYIDLVDQTQSNLVDWSTYDDRRMMISWKTKTPLINLYLRYNSILNQKTKWTVNDDEKGNHLNNVDLRIVELGIIQTQFQKSFKGKINSFSYYLNEINNFLELEMTEEVLDTMLKINRQRWQQMTKRELDYSEFDKHASAEKKESSS